MYKHIFISFVTLKQNRSIYCVVVIVFYCVAYSLFFSITFFDGVCPSLIKLHRYRYFVNGNCAALVPLDIFGGCDSTTLKLNT